VQIAKAFGADVTGVCSTKNLELVRSIGADHVIDYSQEDFRAGAERYDVILDNVGGRSMADTRRALTPTGRLLSNGGGHSACKLGRVIRASLAPWSSASRDDPRSKPRTDPTWLPLRNWSKPAKSRRSSAAHTRWIKRPTPSLISRLASRGGRSSSLCDTRIPR
jgi:NADPH:quinone reductase-like Zn-dependent oxidoreductase